MVKKKSDKLFFGESSSIRYHLFYFSWHFIESLKFWKIQSSSRKRNFDEKFILIFWKILQIIFMKFLKLLSCTRIPTFINYFKNIYIYILFLTFYLPKNTGFIKDGREFWWKIRTHSFSQSFIRARIDIISKTSGFQPVSVAYWITWISSKQT